MSPNKVLAALLLFVFLLFSLITILLWSVRADFLNADAYVTALEQAAFFEVPYELIREGYIPTPGGLLLMEGPLSVISGAQREAVARELAPPEWMRAQLEAAIRDLIAVARVSELGELPDLVISLREVKLRALGEPGERAINLAVETLPVCAPGRDPLALGSDTPVCRPIGLDLRVLLRKLKPLLALLVARVPDTYRVSWQPEQRAVLEDLQQAGQTLDRLQFVLLLLVVLNVALLGLIWLLAVRSPSEWMRWTGIPMLLLGLLMLFLAVLIPQVVSWGLENTTLWVERDVPGPLARALEEAIRGFTPQLFRPAIPVGIALAVVGLLLALVSLLLPGRPRSRPISARPTV